MGNFLVSIGTFLFLLNLHICGEKSKIHAMWGGGGGRMSQEHRETPKPSQGRLPGRGDVRADSPNALLKGRWTGSSLGNHI